MDTTALPLQFKVHTLADMQYLGATQDSQPTFEGQGDAPDNRRDYWHKTTGQWSVHVTAIIRKWAQKPPADILST